MNKIEKSNLQNRKQNLINITSLSIGFIGLLLTVFFYVHSIEAKEPVFVVDSAKTQVLYSGELEDTIKVFDKDGKEIKEDLIIVKCYFWNEGKEPIKRENLLENIIITIGEGNSTVLDYKILKETRDICDISLTQENKDSLNLDFNILENGDGASFQVLYTGSIDDEINIYGTVEGVKKILTNNDIIANPLSKGNLNLFGLSIVIAIVIAVSLMLYSKVIVKYNSFTRRLDVIKIILVSLSTSLIIYLFNKEILNDFLINNIPDFFR